MVGRLQSLYISNGHCRAVCNIYNERRTAAGGRLSDGDPAAHLLAGTCADS
jgi:hypothetical protein